MKGFAQGLALKQKRKATRKSLIISIVTTVLIILPRSGHYQLSSKVFHLSPACELV